jgi:hypothetical protein
MLYTWLISMYGTPVEAVPYWTAKCPFESSTWVIPANVKYSAGLPAAVTCIVNPVYPPAPSPAAQEIEKSAGVTPQTVAASPA